MNSRARPNSTANHFVSPAGIPRLRKLTFLRKRTRPRENTTATGRRSNGASLEAAANCAATFLWGAEQSSKAIGSRHMERFQQELLEHLPLKRPSFVPAAMPETLVRPRRRTNGTGFRLWPRVQCPALAAGAFLGYGPKTSEL